MGPLVSEGYGDTRNWDVELAVVMGIPGIEPLLEVEVKILGLISTSITCSVP